MNTPDSILIIRRFFEALQRLKTDHRIRGKKTFTDKYSINRWNLNTCEKSPERNIFQPAWLAYLVHDYGISPQWLLLGTGDFYLFGNEPQVKTLKKKRPRKEQGGIKEEECSSILTIETFGDAFQWYPPKEPKDTTKRNIQSNTFKKE